MDRFIDSVARVRAYDAAAVDVFLTSAAAERERLLAALDAANERIAAAREQLTVDRDLRTRIGTLVIDAGRRHLQLEADAEAAVAELLTAADAEAEVCVAAARADVARQKLLIAVQHAAEARPQLAPVIDLDRHRTLEVG